MDHPQTRVPTTPNLAHSAVLALVQGAATAAGSALITFTIWWITHH